MRQLLCVLLLLLTVRSARAEESSTLVLEVRAQRVPPSEMEAALKRELTGDADPARGALTLTEPSEDVVQISYRDALGNTATRELHIAKDDPEAVEKVTLAAANLVRDQTRSLLAELSKDDPSTSVASEPETEKPPPVVLAVEPKEKPVEKPKYDPCHGGERLFLGVDLAPFVGTSSVRAGRDAVRYVSLNLFGSYGAGVRGFELSSGVNIGRRGGCGLQIAAFGNVVAGPFHGAQLAIGNLAWGDVRGAQVGVGNLAWGDAWLQAGVGNLARGHATVQLGVGNLALAGVHGAQDGVFNFSWGDTRGAQIGVANITRGKARVQVGVFNYARSATASIGVLSIVPEGRTSLEAWVNENGTSLFGVRHGSNYVHNTYAIGMRFGPTGTRVAYSLGIGARLLSRPRHTWDIDALFESQARTDYYESANFTSRLRVMGTWKVTDRLGLFAAAGYAVTATLNETEKTQSPFGETVFSRDAIASKGSNGRTVGFPSLALGLRVRLGGDL